MKILMILLSLFFTSLCFAAEVSYGIFMVVKGDIKVINVKNETISAKVGVKIFQGETVISGADSRAKIVMSDRNVINISPDTKLKISKYENDVTSGSKSVELNLLEGKVRNNVEQTYDGEKSKFIIKTPTAVAGVRGTQFSTAFDPGTRMTEIVTLKGSVTLATLSARGEIIGKPVIVKKGQATRAAAGSPPETPQAVPKEDLNKIDIETTASSNPKQENSSTVAETQNDKAENKKDIREPASQNDKAAGETAKGDAAQPVDSTKRDPATANETQAKAGNNEGVAPKPASSDAKMIDKKDLDLGMAKDIKNPVAPAPTPPPAVKAPVAPTTNSAVRDIIRDQNGKSKIIVIPVRQ